MVRPPKTGHVSDWLAVRFRSMKSVPLIGITVLSLYIGKVPGRSQDNCTVTVSVLYIAVCKIQSGIEQEYWQERQRGSWSHGGA